MGSSSSSFLGFWIVRLRSYRWMWGRISPLLRVICLSVHNSGGLLDATEEEFLKIPVREMSVCFLSHGRCVGTEGVGGIWDGAAVCAVEVSKPWDCSTNSALLKLAGDLGGDVGIPISARISILFRLLRSLPTAAAAVTWVATSGEKVGVWNSFSWESNWLISANISVGVWEQFIFFLGMYEGGWAFPKLSVTSVEEELADFSSSIASWSSSERESQKDYP